MSADPNNPATWHLVIVDDEPDSIAIVELLCDHYGTRTRSASSGVECLELLQQELPDLLLLDLQMPQMSGWDVLDHVRTDSNASLSTLPIVAMTAYAMAGDRERILNDGFNAYLAKPLSPNTLMQELTQILLTVLPLNNRDRLNS